MLHHKLSECTLESPKEYVTSKVKDKKCLQPKQPLLAIDDDEDSVKWLPSLWFGKILALYISQMIINEMYTTDSGPKLDIILSSFFISIH